MNKNRIHSRYQTTHIINYNFYMKISPKIRKQPPNYTPDRVLVGPTTTPFAWPRSPTLSSAARPAARASPRQAPLVPSGTSAIRPLSRTGGCAASRARSQPTLAPPPPTSVAAPGRVAPLARPVAPPP